MPKSKFILITAAGVIVALLFGFGLFAVVQQNRPKATPQATTTSPQSNSPTNNDTSGNAAVPDSNKQTPPPTSSSTTPSKTNTKNTTGSGDSTTSTSGSQGSSGGSSSPTPSPSQQQTPPPSSDCSGGAHTPGGSDGLGGCWPYASNTGIPSGTSLTTYGGPCTITSGNSGSAVTITGEDATACGILAVHDVAVTIKNSKVPVIDRTNLNGSVDISDSELHGETWVGGVLWGSNITAARVHIVGGQHSVHCESNCTITDSWLHGQEAPNGVGTHNNAFISNGGSNMVVRHNTLYCSAPDNGAGGGCTADASIFGDFTNLSNITFDKNLFMATPSGGYCGSFGYNPSKPYGSNPTNITVSNNVFQKGSNGHCGIFNAVTSYTAANGNSWSNNKYDDGTVLNP